MNLPRAFALIFAAALALAALACEDDAPEPIAAAPTAVPTNAPAPTPSAIPTNTPAPMPTAVPTNAPAPTPTAITPSVQPRGFAVRRISDANIDAVRIYSRAIGALSRSSSYRMQLNESIDFGDGRKMKASTDTYFQFPGTGKTKSALKLGAHAPIEIETILIDGFVYTKKSANPFGGGDNGKWIQERERGDTLGAFLYDPISLFWPDATIETERLDGVETYHLSGSAYSGSLLFGATATSPTSAPLKTDAWIGVEDGHIHRITAATVTAAAETVEITATFSDFDVPVVVEAPKDYYEARTPKSWDGLADVKTTALDSGWTRVRMTYYRWGLSVSAPPGWTFFGAIGDSFYDGMEYFLAALSQEAAYTATQLSRIPKIHYSVPHPHRMTGLNAASEGGETHVSALIVNMAGVLEDAILSEYVDDRMEQTENSLIINGPIVRRPETLPAGDAERVEFAYRLPDEILGFENDDDTEYAQIQYFIMAEGYAYTLTFATTANRIAAMRATFDEMARTARVDGTP